MKSVVFEYISRNKDFVSFVYILVFCVLMCCYMEYILIELNDIYNFFVFKSDLYYVVVIIY